jgi:hypothetical protein
MKEQHGEDGDCAHAVECRDPGQGGGADSRIRRAGTGHGLDSTSEDCAEGAPNVVGHAHPSSPNWANASRACGNVVTAEVTGRRF